MFIVQFPAAYCLAMVASLADSTEPTRLDAVLDLDGQGRGECHFRHRPNTSSSRDDQAVDGEWRLSVPADGAEQVEHEHVAAQVHLVLRVGQGASNVSRGFDGLELEVVGIRLNGLTDHPGRLGITLSPDDDTALVLQSLLHNELGALRLLLGC